MKGPVARGMGNEPAEAASEAGALLPEPSAGQVYSFRTKPQSEAAPPAADRYAAIKILGVDDKNVAVAVLDGIWPLAPGPAEVGAASILEEHRFAHKGKPATFGVSRDGWKPGSALDACRFVAILPVSPAERSFADAIARFAAGSRFAALPVVDRVAEGEWRWAHDRDAFVREVEQRDAKDKAERAAKAARYQNRLSTLSWDQLLSETPFARWSPSPPFPPEAFAVAARTAIHSACEALKALGPKPRKADVRAILKKTVLWFNEADEAAGGVIETEEREDICAVLEEMAHVARQKRLADEIGKWREW